MFVGKAKATGVSRGGEVYHDVLTSRVRTNDVVTSMVQQTALHSCGPFSDAASVLTIRGSSPPNLVALAAHLPSRSHDRTTLPFARIETAFSFGVFSATRTQQSCHH